VAASSDHRLDELGAGGLVVDHHFGRLYGHSGFCGCTSGKAARRGMRRVRKLTGCRAGTRGDDSELQPLDVKIANPVLFAKWSSTEIKIDREDFVVAKESDIVGVVE